MLFVAGIDVSIKHSLISQSPSHTHPRAHTHAHMRTRTHTHTRTHAHTHTRTHAHTHAHTHTKQNLLVCRPVRKNTIGVKTSDPLTMYKRHVVILTAGEYLGITSFDQTRNNQRVVLVISKYLQGNDVYYMLWIVVLSDPHNDNARQRISNSNICTTVSLKKNY